MGPTVAWRGDRVAVIDQTRLPHELVVVELRTVDELIEAITRLVVRGAPALGAVGALGVALAAVVADRDGGGPGRVRADAARLRAARPTAVNLAWAVDRICVHLPYGTAAVIDAAVALAEEDVRINRRLAERGADWVQANVGPRVRVHTHCNAGALATVGWGTALGVVRALQARGGVTEVLADETRPLLQGARLTAFELAGMGVPYRVVVDGAGPSLIARGFVDVVIVGADRIACNGDVANKIGTYPLALAADRAGVPFVVAAPESTVDLATADGAAIPIEDRPPDEVLSFAGVSVAPAGARALNPAFDITPAALVTAIVTETRVVRPARGERVGPAPSAPTTAGDPAA